MARPTFRGPLRAALLDWAGTIVDYGCFAPAVVFVDVFERQGVPITVEEARGPMGTDKRVHLAEITQQPSVARRWRARYGREPGEADIERMLADFVPRQLACLADYADLVPGCLEAIAAFRARGLKIGTTTGYLGSMMDVLLREARAHGFVPDATVCADEVPAGRPEPWMCFENARRLRVFPMEAIVKIGDTVPDVDEGLNAGMWTIGVAKTGNEMGLSLREVEALPRVEYERRLGRAYERLREAGAHYVVDGIGDVPPILDAIDARLARGEKP